MTVPKIRAARGRRATAGRILAARAARQPAGDDPASSRWVHRVALARPKRGRSTLAKASEPPRLYTATIAYCDGDVMVSAFHASVASHPAQVVQRLRARFGDDVVPIAEIRTGFHPAAPMAVALVPSAVADMIRETERNATRPSALSFAVDIEHRIEI